MKFLTYVNRNKDYLYVPTQNKLGLRNDEKSKYIIKLQFNDTTNLTIPSINYLQETLFQILEEKKNTGKICDLIFVVEENLENQRNVH